MLTLILGGARSGKSRYAQSLCGGDDVIYLATATIDGDPEMQARVTRHRQERPHSWKTIEEHERVAEAVRDATPRDAPVIVDCVTVWIANLFFKYASLSLDEQETTIVNAVNALADGSRIRPVIAVSNEVGDGLVPESEVGRRFRDLQGLANQLLAREATHVVLLVAGLTLKLKDAAPRPNEMSL